MGEAPNYPTITWHLVDDYDPSLTACTGSKWSPPRPDEYPDVPRELCVACAQLGTMPRVQMLSGKGENDGD